MLSASRDRIKIWAKKYPHEAGFYVRFSPSSFYYYFTPSYSQHCYLRYNKYLSKNLAIFRGLLLRACLELYAVLNKIESI